MPLRQSTPARQSHKRASSAPSGRVAAINAFKIKARHDKQHGRLVQYNRHHLPLFNLNITKAITNNGFRTGNLIDVAIVAHCQLFLKRIAIVFHDFIVYVIASFSHVVG